MLHQGMLNRGMPIGGCQLDRRSSRTRPTLSPLSILGVAMNVACKINVHQVRNRRLSRFMARCHHRTSRQRHRCLAGLCVGRAIPWTGATLRQVSMPLGLFAASATSTPMAECIGGSALSAKTTFVPSALVQHQSRRRSSSRQHQQQHQSRHQSSSRRRRQQHHVCTAQQVSRSHRRSSIRRRHRESVLGRSFCRCRRP